MFRLVLSCCFYVVVVTAFYPHTLPALPAKLFSSHIIFNAASNHPSNDEFVTIEQQTEKKPFRRKKFYLDENKRTWLHQATEQFLQLYNATGTLPEGKWHEAMSLFNAWGNYQKEPGHNAALRMEAILNILASERIITGNTNINITIHTYNKLMDAWACAALFNTIPDPILASQRLYEILVTLQEKFDAYTHSTFHSPALLLANYNITANNLPIILPLKPNSESFHIALHAVCKVEGVVVARRLLAYMEHLYRSGKNEDAQPTRSQYIQILDAYARVDSYQSSTLAEAFLRHLKYNYDHRMNPAPLPTTTCADRDNNMNSIPLLPDTLCYNIVIRAWSRHRRGREAAEHADRLLEEMKESQSEHCRPDIVTYGCKCHKLIIELLHLSNSIYLNHTISLLCICLAVIAAWAASGMKVHAINRVEDLIREIDDSDYLEANTVVLNSLMSAWVKAKNPAAIERTEEILRQMEISSSAKPDLVSYNTYLHALSIHSSPKRPDLSLRAESLLCKMEDECKRGVLSFGPNTFSYNLVLESICRGAHDSHVVVRAANVLRRMIHTETVEPDTYSFNQVLILLSKKSTNATQVEELLRHMDEGLYASAKPDVASFHAVMYAYSRVAGRPSAEHAERLLNEMKSRAASGEVEVKPNRLCYNTVIDCWAKSGEGTYGARKAEALLQEMQDNFFAGDGVVSPNILTFNAVLNAWARSGTRCCGYKAEKYLNQMWQLYNAGNVQVKPNDFSYNTVINAISKSKHKEKGQKALRVLRRMDKLYLAGNKEARPNEITYTAVINSCAFPSVRDSRTRRKALDTAIFTLKELQASRYGRPNQVTYGTFIRACANLLHDDYVMRRAIIKKAFEQCCKDGQVGQMVLNYIPKDLYCELLDGHFSTSYSKISLEDVPAEWKRNVDDKMQWGPHARAKNVKSY